MKKVKIQELADVLGISYTAVKKKIKTDPADPKVKRYKNRYTVITENVDGRTAAYILFDDEDYQNEIKKYNVNKTVNKTGERVQETYNSDGEIVDISPLPPIIKKDELMEFTNRYIERYERDIKQYNERLLEKDKTILELKTELAQKSLSIKDYILIVLFITVIFLIIYVQLKGLI